MTKEDSHMDKPSNPNDEATAGQAPASAHTPGPWRAAIGDDWRPRYGENRDFVCVEHAVYDAIDVYALAASQSAEEHFGNARLIAAAPDLLAACQALMAIDDDSPTRETDQLAAEIQIHLAVCKATGTDPVDGSVLAAIAKAEGR